MLLRTIAILWIAAACGSERSATPEPLTVTIGTHEHVFPLRPLQLSGVNAAIAELVYSRLGRYVSSRTELGGDRLRFSIRPDSPLDAAHLAPLIHDPDLTVTVVEGGLEIVCRAPQYLPYVGLDLPLVDDGPYTGDPARSGPDTLTLRRRSGEGPDEIVIRNFGTQDEEWRHFLTREIDVVPKLPAGAQDYLGRIPSIRIVKLPEPFTVALLFNVGHPLLADRELRRALALALDRRALGEVVTGDAANGRDIAQDLPRAQAAIDAFAAAHGHVKLGLTVITAAKSFELAALVVRAQLEAVGLEVQIETAEPNQKTMERMVAHDFDMELFYGGIDAAHFVYYLSHTPADTTDYVNPDFDDAVKRGDARTAAALLERDVPATPLFDDPQYVGIDGRLCGGIPVRGSDLAWVADLHRCEP